MREGKQGKQKHKQGKITRRERTSPEKVRTLVLLTWVRWPRPVPACFFFLGLLAPGETEMPSVHNARFDFNDHAIKTGVEVFCSLALGAGEAAS